MCRLVFLMLLLPAVVSARCNHTVMWMLFDRIDLDTNKIVNRTETDAFFSEIDDNGDKKIPLDEVKRVIDVIAPKLTEYVDDVFPFIDADKNGIVTESDIDMLYLLVDTDRSDSCSAEEFDSFLKWYCWSNKFPCRKKGWGGCRNKLGLGIAGL